MDRCRKSRSGDGDLVAFTAALAELVLVNRNDYAAAILDRLIGKSEAEQRAVMDETLRACRLLLDQVAVIGVSDEEMRHRAA